ncbi:bifunctional DNA-binding transcriptional regulator/O6-methylguanine-DNA methyltransferase Ada [Herbaspirillum sp. LeCh32-8]|uniref:bifunctional DNA-binding transcriptional regulator/O6-methylguanine-DNA methyltransferase Ada n=1 Tax=Herbaspirillum sp. LeCh32-8 TaxID=2821356 RepID=UPI001AE8BD41|nr:bifunctional DNA-binding transcriptional regulator/O6-methylguanine-DNA methyltransferase Ada [Herbaspirillum sp. LeCh32-8]MBP0600144.1 bifunctional DNA-binding transcriptional regulator/O6-methylguanine-DNA methyltransferase Ada [Herbaspirillum sp. LeCh32-8]
MTNPNSRRSARLPTPAAAPALPASGYAGDEARWAAVQQREKAADGQFYYSVRSTGVYCKPSCGARPALRKNVAFHDSCAAAEAAGFRACKRCKPDQPSLEERQAQAVEQACRLIDAADGAPDLATLAEAVGLSRYHFHRIFKAHTGLTPKAYADARRAERMRERLPGSASVTEAMYDAGYNSSGRFYAHSGERLGMTPGAYRRGGNGERIRFAVAHCWLGELLVAATDKGICAVTLGEDAEVLVQALQDRFPQAELVGGDVEFEQTLAQVVGAIEDPQRGIDLPLDVRGTAFQQRVWQALRSVPPGVTLSYSQLAERVGSPAAVRAVASACANNEIALLIPCHRIVRLDGSPSGYRWGVERKQALLERESPPGQPRKR